MNQTILIGRITKDVELKQAGSTVCTRFTLAVNKDYKDKDGKRGVDFINCVAYGQTANFMKQYVHKGDRLSILGKLSTRNYQNQHQQTVYVTEVKVERVSVVCKNQHNDITAEQFSQEDVDYLTSILQ